MVVGDIIQDFTLLELIEKRRRRKDTPQGYRLIRWWKVRCKCGREIEITEKSLINGAGKCVGCSHSGENCSGYKHGKAVRRSETPEYRCWKSIRTRCYNQNFKQYPDYGGRGIKVCDRWNDSFENFLADMGERPSPQHSIDREDNNGDYSPDNCRWATSDEQRANRSCNTIIKVGNREQALFLWLRELKLSKATFMWRKRHGWSDEEALFGR